MANLHTFSEVRSECLTLHYENRNNINEFFWQLREDGAVYSPTLGAAVLWCEWKSGGEVVDRTFEVVFDVTPDNLREHVEFIREWGGWNKWATDLLADFDHYSFNLNEEDEVRTCIAVLAAICTVPDWTSNPKEVLCHK